MPKPEKNADSAPLEARRGYDLWAQNYNDHDPTTALDEPLLQEVAGDLRGKQALDVGCGTGRYARLLAQHGARVTGVDLSYEMLARAQTRGDGALRWVQGSVTLLPVRSESFDMVVSGLVLDHLRTLDGYFEEIARVLKPGGRALVSSVHSEQQKRLGAQVDFAEHGHEHHIRGFVHEVKEMVNSAQGAHLNVTWQRDLYLTRELVGERPQWLQRLGRPALVVLLLHKPD